MKHAILHFSEPVFEPESRQIQYLQRTCKNKSRRSVLLKDSIYLKLSLPDSYDRLVPKAIETGYKIVIASILNFDENGCK